MTTGAQVWGLLRKTITNESSSRVFAAQRPVGSFPARVKGCSIPDPIESMKLCQERFRLKRFFTQRS